MLNPADVSRPSQYSIANKNIVETQFLLSNGRSCQGFTDVTFVDIELGDWTIVGDIMLYIHMPISSARSNPLPVSHCVLIRSVFCPDFYFDTKVYKLFPGQASTSKQITNAI